MAEWTIGSRGTSSLRPCSALSSSFLNVAASTTRTHSKESLLFALMAPLSPASWQHHAVPCCVVSETLNWKNVVLVLGRRLPLDKSQCSEFVCRRAHTFSGRPPPPRCAAAWTRVCPLADEESALMVWNSTMPMEVKDLRRHCEKREQIAAKMREQLHHDWSCAFLFPFFHLQYFYFPIIKT